MPAPSELEQLVKRFRDNLSDLKDPAYKEEQLRIEYLNPFFKLLGWDVYNELGRNNNEKEVVHEARLRIGQATKAPDYAFRLGGDIRFYVEAKKPYVPLQESGPAAFQLRRYGWSRDLPVSVLTDFEEFAVYNCNVRPHRHDKPTAARLDYWSYEQYIEEWDTIAAVFGRSAGQGYTDYVEKVRDKRGNEPVDAAFLKEIEGWRDSLARNIALRNPDLTVGELNHAVQRTIDRIIFLRIAEDRGIEPYKNLVEATGDRDIYPRLVGLFHQADARYNSGLFHFSKERNRPGDPDDWTPQLAIDDKVLSPILRRLYFPDSPYEFSVLPVEILGQVYEQFLGKVIRLTEGHRAKIEEKPEVRKAGGVYYTPQYVVEYIVEQTLGELLKGKSVKQAQKLRVLDPACGSGSFLLGAYRYLLNWHLGRYVEEDPEKHARGTAAVLRSVPPDEEGGPPNWALTTAEKKRILLDNIYGVDIDEQAVEVTKLSLLLAVLEGETTETVGAQMRLHAERALPELSSNIKCGNSLIGTDFYQTKAAAGLETETLRRINPFDWEAEFSDIMGRGGFDAVIGNPPYGMISDDIEKMYLKKTSEVLEGRYDNYELFIEKGIRLNKRNGLLGYIVPSPLLSNLYAKKLREYILNETAVREITNFSMDVFSDPTVHTCIIILEKSHLKHLKVNIRKQVVSAAQLSEKFDYSIDQTALGDNKNRTFDIFLDPKIEKILNRDTVPNLPLGEICYIRQCIKTGDNEKYVVNNDVKPSSPWKPSLRGKSIDRYSTHESDLFVKYGDWLARNWKNKSFYETPKIGVRETGKRIIATIDRDNRYFLSSLYAVYPKDSSANIALEYYLGLLNSKFATFFVKIIAYSLTEGAFTKIRTNQLSRLPIPVLDMENSIDVQQHDEMVRLVETMLGLHKEKAAAKTSSDRTLLERRITATDNEIDHLVYQLYDLTEEDIAIVEGKG